MTGAEIKREAGRWLSLVGGVLPGVATLMPDPHLRVALEFAGRLAGLGGEMLATGLDPAEAIEHLESIGREYAKAHAELQRELDEMAPETKP